MTAALTPELAIAYVRELSADVRAVVVLDARGDLLAGPRSLAEPARALLAAASGPDVDVRVEGGLVVASRTAAHALVVAAGPHALPGPHRLDARAAVQALGDGAALDRPVSSVQSQTDPSGGEALLNAARMVISATHRRI